MATSDYCGVLNKIHSEMLSAALEHAAKGRPVFPCRQDDKRPYVAHGHKDATTDRERIIGWWTKYPDAMIGMPTGARSKTLVVDVDVKGGIDGNDTLFELCDGRELPETVEALTPSGGRHIYFRYPKDGTEVRNSASKIGSALDIRAEGGYVILPPSISASGVYEWEASSDPDSGVRAAAVPDWLLALVRSDPKRAPSKNRLAGAPIAEGARNDTLFRLGASLRAKGLTEAAILGALRAENEARCDPPLPDDDIVKISGSAGRYAPGAGTEPQPPPPASPDDYGVNAEPTTGYQFPDDISDDTLALTFADAHPHLRFVELRGKWMRWTGMHWEEDSTGHTLNDIRVLLRRTQAPTDKQRKSMLSARTVTAVERLARVDRRIAATIDQWDQDDWALNTPAGVIDLRTGKILPHTMDGYHTKITKASPGGLCPMWHRFIKDITGGDRLLASYLQRVIGYSITGTTREHALFFAYGTGANGKGTMLNTLTDLLSGYVKVTPMETFMDSPTDQHPTSVAALQGARLVISQEVTEGRRWNESKIKSTTGGDPVTARFMRQDEFTYRPKFKLFVAANHKPRLKNVDEAMRRRMNLIPFTVTIPPERRDTNLEEKLRAEWPGILQWAIDGCLSYQQMGLKPPACVVEATEEYFTAQDIFSEWLDECCEIGDENWETPTLLFNSWKAFADRRNERPGRQTEFTDKMEARGFRKLRDMVRGRFWRGLKIVKVDDAADRMY